MYMSKDIIQEKDSQTQPTANPKENPNGHFPDMIAKISQIPYPTYLSFGPLFSYMKETLSREGLEHTPVFETGHKLLEQAPELLQAFTDLSLLEKHHDLVQILINAVIPPVAQETQLAKLSRPFDMQDFYRTEQVKRLMEDKEKNVRYEVNRSQELLHCVAVIAAGSLILNHHYGQNIEIAPTMLITVEEKDRKQYFRMNIDSTFVNVECLKPLKKLTQQQINILLTNIYDLDAWLEALPPENFAFQGFMVSNLIEITEEESLSRLKQGLLQRDAIVSLENIQKIEQLVRNYLGTPDLHMGITALDYPRERTIAHKYKIRFNLLAEEVDSLLNESFNSSVYYRACHYKEVLLIEDLSNMKDATPLEHLLVEKGIRSILAAPLLDSEDNVIGLLEIGTSQAYGLHSFTEIKFREIISLFNIAMERSRREIDNQIEAIIREQFTDIHPSVEWRFVEASYNLLEKREAGEKQAMVEPIVFEDVYPLYGQADIVGSSQVRNQSIQQDLLKNLSFIRELLDKIESGLNLPLLRKYIMDVELAIHDLEDEFNSNDESRIVDLLHHTIHPILNTLKNRHPEIKPAVDQYFRQLDPDLGIIYQARKNYEDAVLQINNAIGDYLDQQNAIAQEVLPHYYTKYKTDGVEYDLYVGKSLLKSDQYCDMYLHNFRLQQLIDMAQITRLTRRLQDQLPLKLNTAQLLFAYTNTLSIRFREDEKQFDVDGAYNVRYEILKKRIDKAVIAGTTERLTQADKVTIVYLQDKDRQEYMEYLKFLKHDGFIKGEIEDLSLGKLQGAQGLKALRFTVS